MLTKYKILGGAIGTAVAGYGVYESAMYFGTSRKYIGAKTEEIQKEDFKKKNDQEENQTPLKATENKPDKATPQPKLDPSEPNPQTPQKNPAPIITDKPQVNPGPQKLNPPKDPIQNSGEKDYGLFGSEDDGSIGWQFKDFLIGSGTHAAWTSKVNLWNTNLNNSRIKGSFHSAFQLSNQQNATIDALQTRCKNAYRKKNWGEFLNSKDSDAGKYWSTVSLYCSDPNAEWPSNWYGG